MKKLLSALLAGVMAITVLAGCSSQSTQAPETQPQTQAPASSAARTETPATAAPTQEPAAVAQNLRFAMTVDAPTLDQNKASSAASSTVGRGIYEGLVGLKDGVTPIPGVAESWEVSEDSRTYTFHLRNNAKWSNGDIITANDFKYSWTRLLDPATATPYAFMGYIIVGGLAFNSGEGTAEDLAIEVVDDFTLKVTLEYPAPYFLAMLDHIVLKPVNQKFCEAQGEKYSQEPENLLYNGPFVLKEWKHEEYLLLEKNPLYWDADNIKLDTVKIFIIKSGTEVALDMFNNGELDFVDIPTIAWDRYITNPDVLFVSYGAVDWLSLKHDNKDCPWLGNKNFRLALNYAVDRDDFITLAYKDLMTSGTRLVLPDVQGYQGRYFDEYNITSFPTKADPEKAQEYLRLAMEELNITDASKITVTLITSDDANSKLQAEILQDMFISNLGIDFQIQLVTYAQKLENDHNSTYEAVFKGWMPDYNDPMTYMELLQTGNGEATLHWFNKEYDDLIEKARYEADPKTRMDYFAQAEQLIYDDAAIVPLQVRRRAWLCSPKLNGIVRNFMVSEDYVHSYFSE